MIVECLNYIPINKGTFQGYADLYIEDFDLEIYGCKLHKKNNARWITLPSKEIIDDFGNVKYISIIKFCKYKIWVYIAQLAKEAIDKFIEEKKSGSAKVVG